MYNVIHAWRPTYRRSQTHAGGRAASRSSDECPRGACEARGCCLVGGAAKMSGRMGPVEFLTFKASGQGATTHERGARDLRPGLRGIRLQTAAPQTSSAMRRDRMASTAKNRSTTSLPSLLGLTPWRLPSVASGKPQDDDSRVLNRAGSTLAGPCFGLENGVHPILRHIGDRSKGQLGTPVGSNEPTLSAEPSGRRRRVGPAVRWVECSSEPEAVLDTSRPPNNGRSVFRAVVYG